GTVSPGLKDHVRSLYIARRTVIPLTPRLLGSRHARRADNDVSGEVEMRILALCVRAAALTAAVILLGLPDAPLAQRAREQGDDEEKARATPAMRLSLLEGLGEAQTCM